MSWVVSSSIIALKAETGTPSPCPLGHVCKEKTKVGVKTRQRPARGLSKRLDVALVGSTGSHTRRQQSWVTTSFRGMALRTGHAWVAARDMNRICDGNEITSAGPRLFAERPKRSQLWTRQAVKLLIILSELSNL
jgi:hypothetical protein